MSTNLKPLHDRVIVRRIEEGELIRGGIIIPETAKDKPQEGEVLAVGDGKATGVGCSICGRNVFAPDCPHVPGLTYTVLPPEGGESITDVARVVKITQPLDVKPGDRVLFGKYSGAEITLDGDTLLILREEEIHAIVERS